MIDKIPRQYELKARIAPGLVVALPALVEVIYMVPVLSNVPSLPQTTFLPACRRFKALKSQTQQSSESTLVQ